MAELTPETHEPGFTGFPPAAFVFYATLADNNEKAWFEANRDTFETAVKAPLAALLADGAETFGGTVKISRPFRDVRFSRDKTPYKDRLFGGIHPAAKGSSDRGSGLYAAISAEGVVAGAGYHDMAPDQLARYRAALDDETSGATFERALDEAGAMERRGRSLKTAPKGYARDHPRVDLLRMKEVILIRRFAPADCGKGLREAVFAAWREALPVVEWLDRHVGPAELTDRRRRP